MTNDEETFVFLFFLEKLKLKINILWFPQVKGIHVAM